MKTRKVGTTDVELSEVSLGTWGLASDAYGRSDHKRAARVATRALELGVTTFDTSPLWGDGVSEKVIGEVMAEHGRDEVQVIARAGARWNDGALDLDTTKDALRADFDRSLERLQTERIDVWLLHEPKGELWERDDWRELVDELKKDEKIGSWGASVSTPEGARLALEAGADVLCMTYNILASDDLHDLAADIAKAEASVIARSPLMYGLLAGRWAEYRSFPRTDHRRDRWSAQALRARIRQVDKLRFLVHGEVASLAEASLRYVLANSLVRCALVGARTPAQIESACAASSDTQYLPDEDLVKIPQVLAATMA
ncbi:MAG: aldo/keto reductase [Deltaproteobacteria bacterium]|nr:aldo/keto reductase [Deltaproteobacteria bacterium]